MYLKEIEISGFKSFADKLTIQMDQDITCIVGPNGSGKSNIVDAIRWVLGEQSVKALRGEDNMRDIIFSGCATRNPLNVASVCLTFDNSDHYLNLPYENVSVKRRIYRNGENEYLINGEKVRLKDVNELFLDSGIGKSSSNIISQGEVAKILSYSSKDRRSIIESSAGILKYKERREEALRKLDKANIELDRVNDIIGELETRVEPLKEQSEKATEYLKVKDELSNVEIGLLVEEITNLNNESNNNKNKLETLNNNLLELNNKITNTKFEELKLNEINLEKEIQDLNKNIVLKTEETEKLNSKKNLLNERSKYDSNDIKVHENIVLLKENKLKISNEIDLLNKDLENINNDIEKKEEFIKNNVVELNTLKDKKEALNREFNTKTREYESNRNKILVLKENIDNNSTINSNTKKVLNNPRLNGIYDAFSNCLEVNPKYSKSFEVIISSIKNNIIVENEEAAKKAINYLKQNNLGRVTFYPISVMKPRGIEYDVLELLENEIDYLGILADFAEYDSKYKNVILNQLGNVIVVTDIDAGNRIAKLINNRYRIVTLDGDVLNVGGSITGGSINTQTSTITLKNELNDLIIKNNSYDSLLNNIKEEILKIEKNIELLDKDILLERSKYLELKTNLDNINTNIKDKENILESIELELDNLNKIESLDKEQELITNEYYKLKKEKELLEKDLQIKNKDLSNIKSLIEEEEAKDRLNNSEIRRIEKEIKELELSNTRIDSKLDNDLEILNSEYEMTYERAHDNYSLDLEFEEARKIVSKCKSKLKEIGMVSLESIEEYKTVSERYNFLTNQRDDILKAKDMLYQIIDEMDTIMKEDFKTTFEELKVEFEKVFKQLFKGGQAKLVLTNPEDLLTTGVDIEACPPGKTLKTITGLSGGEQTLTAISLLFAMLNVRRVPFCIFDEVEAALDEANVDTFGHYLDNYKNKTQFVLITHKKRTMEYANNLYGITMQEKGVSKLVSVKLK